MQKTLRLLLFLCLLTLTACGAGATEETGGPDSDTGDVAADAFMGNCTEVTGPLRLWNWSEYMDPDVVSEFSELYGVEVTEDNFSSNEEVLTKLRAGNSGYDIIFPSDYAVEIMAAEGLIQSLDKENIPNLANVDDSFTAPYYDPNDEFSVPYMWGVAGIAYNQRYFETAPTSWATIFDPATIQAQEGSFTMLDDEREAIGAALKYLGYSLNDTDPARIAEARDLLLAQKQLSQFYAYNSDNFYDSLAGEETLYAHAWSGGSALAAAENPDIRFVVPEEGSTIFMDTLAIAADAPNKCTAELFINFILQPEIAGRLVDYTYYNSPVTGALDNATEETRAILSSGFTPDDATLERLEWIERAGDAVIFSDTWTEIKAR